MLEDMEGQHSPLLRGSRMGTHIMTPQIHSAFQCPGVGGKGMVPTGGGTSLDAWQRAVSSRHGAGTCAGSILPGTASGMTLPEAAVRVMGEPQPVVTPCPGGCQLPGTILALPGTILGTASPCAIPAHARGLSGASSCPVWCGEEPSAGAFGVAQTNNFWLSPCAPRPRKPADFRSSLKTESSLERKY